MSLTLKPRHSALTTFTIPEHIRNSSPEFVKFVEYYYQFLELEGSPVDVLQDLSTYKDIDDAPESLVDLVWGFYSSMFPDFAAIDKRLLIKNINSFFRAKGTLPSYEFIINALYGEDVTLAYNHERVFRASANSYDDKVFIAVLPDTQSDDFQLAIGERLIQSSSDSFGIIEDVTPYQLLNGETQYIIELNSKNIKGVFEELLPVSSENRVDGEPINGRVSASVVGVIPTNTGTYYREDDQLKFFSGSGEGVSGFVDSVASGSIDGVIISQKGKGYKTGDTIEIIDRFSAGDGFRGEVTKVDGVGASATPIMEVDSISIKNGGQRFEIGDKVFIRDSRWNPVFQTEQFVATVSSILSSNSIIGMKIQNYGSSYLYANPILFDCDTGGVVAEGGGTYSMTSYVARRTSGNMTELATIGNGNISRLSAGSVYDVEFLDIGEVGASKYLSAITNGFGAKVTPTFASGSITAITVDNGGFNYINPIIEILSSDGYGAIASVTKDATGTILTVTMDKQGQNYTVGETIVRVKERYGPTSGGGAVVTFTANGSGVLTGSTIIQSGSGFAYPEITFPTHNGATPTLTITKNELGSITGISIVSGGSGFTPGTVKCVIRESNTADTSLSIIEPVYATAFTGAGVISGLSITSGGAFNKLGSTYSVNMATDDSVVRSGAYRSKIYGSGLVVDLTFKVNGHKIKSGGKFYHFGAGEPASNTVAEYTGGVGVGLKLNMEFTSGVLTDVAILNAGSGYLDNTEVYLDSRYKSLTPAITGAAILEDKLVYLGKRYTVVDIGEYVSGTGVGSTIESLLTLSTIGSSVRCPVSTGPLIRYDGIDAVLSATFDNGVLTGVGITTAGSGFTDDNLILLDGWHSDQTYRISNQTIADATCVGSSTGSIINTTLKNGGVGYWDSSEILPIKITVTSNNVDGIVATPARIAPILNTSDGSISRITILESGSRYTSLPTITLSGGIHPIDSYSATPVFLPRLFDGKLVSVDVITSPTSLLYGTAIEVLGDGIDAEVTLDIGTGLTSFTIENAGGVAEFMWFYHNNSGIMPLNVGNFSGPAPTILAVVDAIINSSGQISSIIIRSEGSGYYDPICTIQNPGGIASVLFFADRRIRNVSITNNGSNYTNATPFIQSEGFGAVLSLIIDAQGGVKDLVINDSGRGYTSMPRLDIVDKSGYGSISEVTIIERGAGFTTLPKLELPEPDIIPAIPQSGVTYYPRIGAKLLAVSRSIGRIRKVYFKKFGLNYTEVPVVSFPLHTIMTSVRGYKIGEKIRIAEYPYQYSTLSFGDRYLTEDSFTIINESGSYLKIESNTTTPDIYPIQSFAGMSYLLLTLSTPPKELNLRIGHTVQLIGSALKGDPADIPTPNLDGSWLITDVQGFSITLKLPDSLNSFGNDLYRCNDIRFFRYEDGPQGTIQKAESENNMLSLTDATDSYSITSEDGRSFKSEDNTAILEAEYSYAIKPGSTIIGVDSGFSAKMIQNSYTRATGVSIRGAAGRTKSQFLSDVGILSESRSRLPNNWDIQDFSYSVRTGLALDTYASVLRKTVHPAGYKMLGEVVTFTRIDFPDINLFGDDIYGGGTPPLTLIIDGSFYDVYRFSVQRLPSDIFSRRFQMTTTTMEHIDSYFPLFSQTISGFDYATSPAVRNLEYTDPIYTVTDLDIVTTHPYSLETVGSRTGMIKLDNINGRRKFNVGSFVELQFNFSDQTESWIYNSLSTENVSDVSADVLTNVITRTGGFSSTNVVVGSIMINPNTTDWETLAGTSYEYAITNAIELGFAVVETIVDTGGGVTELTVSTAMNTQLTGVSVKFIHPINPYTQQTYLAGDGNLDLSVPDANALRNSTESTTVGSYSAVDAFPIFKPYKIMDIIGQTIYLHDTYGLAAPSGTCMVHDMTWKGGYRTKENSMITLNHNISFIHNTDVAYGGDTINTFDVSFPDHGFGVGSYVYMEFYVPGPNNVKDTQILKDSLGDIISITNANTFVIRTTLTAGEIVGMTGLKITVSYEDQRVASTFDDENVPYTRVTDQVTATSKGHSVEIGQKILVSFNQFDTTKFNQLVTISNVVGDVLTFTYAGDINNTGNLSITII